MHYRISDKDEIVAVVNVFDSLYVFILLITKCYPSKKGHIEKFWSKSGLRNSIAESCDKLLSWQYIVTTIFKAPWVSLCAIWWFKSFKTCFTSSMTSRFCSNQDQSHPAVNTFTASPSISILDTSSSLQYANGLKNKIKTKNFPVLGFKTGNSITMEICVELHRIIVGKLDLLMHICSYSLSNLL